MKSRFASAVLTALIVGQAALVAVGVGSVVVRANEHARQPVLADQQMRPIATAGI